MISRNVKTLKEFIEDNDKLLTAAGVFAALTTIFASESNIDPSLSFFSFLLFLLLCLELLFHYLLSLSDTEKQPTTNLVFFGVFLTMLLIAIGYQIKDIYDDIIIKLFSPMFAIFYAFASSVSIYQIIIKKYKSFEANKMWVFILILIVMCGIFLFLCSI